MKTEYVVWGHPIDVEEQSLLPGPLRRLGEVCADHSCCEVIEFRRITTNHYAIIVDIGDGTFDHANLSGICRVERIALGFRTDVDSFLWDVRALRADFPITLHQNHVPAGEPRSLCLYSESWPTIERTWTPCAFLNRVFWWLRETAEGHIHQKDQPIEQLFFSSPSYFILSKDHFGKFNDQTFRLEFDHVSIPEIGRETFFARYVKVADINQRELPRCISISVLLPPISNVPVEKYPETLGELAQKISDKGSDIIVPLRNTIKSMVSSSGVNIKDDFTQLILLIVGVPRERDGVQERVDVQGFILKAHFGQLGESIAALFRMPNKKTWYADYSSNPVISEDWKLFSIYPVEIILMPSKEDIRHYSGVVDSQSDFNGVIAGTGALGSSVAEIWGRECWGTWDYIDDDIVKPHNLVRHLATADVVGFSKSQAVRDIISRLFFFEPENNSLAHVKKLGHDLEWMKQFIFNKNLVVDATTTLHVPRDLSVIDAVPRVVTIFLTPSGMSSVMLLEDSDREIRSISLEAQYYRAILSSDSWGMEHLKNNQKSHWVGAGCREISVSISNELVKLHAAIIARQLRKIAFKAEPKICVWDHDDTTGGVHAFDIPVGKTIAVDVGDWKVLWDELFERQLRLSRVMSLPNETGGILLGFVDFKLKTIMLVLAMNAPEDSLSSPYGFIRGTKGLQEQLDECHRRTANIVSYIGEWHSHPTDCSASLSVDDDFQLRFLTDVMARDGRPVMVLIVSDTEISISIEGVTGKSVKCSL